METLVKWLLIYLAAMWTFFPVMVWWYLSGSRDRLQDVKELLQSLIDLQRTRRDLSAMDAEEVKKGEGSGDTRPAKVSQIESYGDLSRVGLLKNRKT